MARREKMGRLFALQAKVPITEQKRHGWATIELNRQHDPVTTYRDLTENEIDRLSAAAERIINGSPEDDYVMCGAPCPDGWPCVVDAGHVGRGEDHAREDGLAWPVRL